MNKTITIIALKLLASVNFSIFIESITISQMTSIANIIHIVFLQLKNHQVPTQVPTSVANSDFCFSICSRILWLRRRTISAYPSKSISPSLRAAFGAETELCCASF